jgi:hypothetical protein
VCLSRRRSIAYRHAAHPLLRVPSRLLRTAAPLHTASASNHRRPVQPQLAASATARGVSFSGPVASEHCGRRLHLFTILALAAAGSVLPKSLGIVVRLLLELSICSASRPVLGFPTRAPVAPSKCPHPKSAPSPDVVDWLALGCAGGSLGQGIVNGACPSEG